MHPRGGRRERGRRATGGLEFDSVRAAGELPASSPVAECRCARCRTDRPILQPSVAKLGIVVVVNPPHFAAGEIVKKRLEPVVAAGYHPLKSLLARGIVVAIGSDLPRSPFIM
jgi:hypothetical protein